MSDEKASENKDLDNKNKLFFVKNSQYNTKALEMYLNRRDFVVNVSSDLNETVEKIKEFKPHYLFIAWDHKSINVPELLLKVQENDPENRIVVIPFITSTSTSDVSRLMQVDAPVKLLPPISGPSVQRLISKYEKDFSTMTTQKGAMAQSHQSASDVINVKAFHSGEASENNIHQNHPGHLQHVYISKGQKLAEITTAASGSIVMLVDDVIEPHNEKPFFDSITDLTSEKPYAKFSRFHFTLASAGQKLAAAQVFDRKIKPELTEVIETLKENSTPEKVSSSFGVLVQSVDCSGVVFLQSEWNIQIDEAESALITWAKELTSFYHKGQSTEDVNYEVFQSPVLKVTIPPEKDIYAVIAEKSATHKELIIDDKKTTLAFFDMPDNPFNIEPYEDEQYFLIDTQCFKASTRIDFDVYLQLKENKKIIKYLKSDSDITDIEVKSLLEKRVAPVMIENQAEMNWYKYGLESFLFNL